MVEIWDYWTSGNWASDNPEAMREKILGVMFAQFPVGEIEGKLVEELTKIFEREGQRDSGIIRKYFQLDPRYHDCPDLELVIGGQRDFGARMGLRNIGSEYHYVTTHETGKFAEEVKRRGFFDPETIEYIEGLGRELAARFSQ